jgi:hypothetical protein
VGFCNWRSPWLLMVRENPVTFNNLFYAQNFSAVLIAGIATQRVLAIDQ